MDSTAQTENKFHISVFLPNAVASNSRYWQGNLQNFKVKSFNLPRKTFVFIKKLMKRLPYVFYSKHHGLEKTQLWIGRPKCEEEALVLSNLSKFVIGVHTSESVNDIEYECCVKCARYNGLRKEGSSICIPVYIGVNPKSCVTLLSETVYLNEKMKYEDNEKVKKIALYMEQCILSDCLNCSDAEITCSDTALQAPVNHPKKYLYCMVGDTSSKEAKEFQHRMQEELKKSKASSTIYEGFWDWESEFGKDMGEQFEEKLQQSHFVVAIFQDGDTVVNKHNLQAAFKYHIEKSIDGNTERYIPILMSGIHMPVNLQIMSALDFSVNHMGKRNWSKLTKAMCDNISILQVSPFQKFDYCIHEGSNILQNFTTKDKPSSKCRVLDSFILHNQRKTSNMLDSLITEIIDCKKSERSCQELVGKYMCSMAKRTDFIMQLMTEVFNHFTSNFEKEKSFNNIDDFIFVSNKQCMSAKLMYAQILKLVFVTQSFGQHDTIELICNIATNLRDLELRTNTGRVIADIDFPNVIQDMHSEYIVESLSAAPKKLRSALRTILYKIHSVTDGSCETCVKLSHSNFLQKVAHLESLYEELSEAGIDVNEQIIINQFWKTLDYLIWNLPFLDKGVVITDTPPPKPVPIPKAKEILSNDWERTVISIHCISFYNMCIATCPKEDVIHFMHSAITLFSYVLTGQPPYYSYKLKTRKFERMLKQYINSIHKLDKPPELTRISSIESGRYFLYKPTPVNVLLKSNKERRKVILDLIGEQKLKKVKRKNDNLDISRKAIVKLSRRIPPKINKERHKVNVVKLFKRTYKR